MAILVEVASSWSVAQEEPRNGWPTAQSHNSNCETRHVMRASGNFCIPGEDLRVKPQPQLAPEDAIALFNNTGLRHVVCHFAAG